MVNTWTIYEIDSDSIQHGVRMRGRLRKFAVENKIEFLVENASDKPNIVRFALKEKASLPQIEAFVQTIVTNPVVTKVMEDVQNPVLSQLKTNIIERYAA